MYVLSFVCPEETVGVPTFPGLLFRLLFAGVLQEAALWCNNCAREPYRVLRGVGVAALHAIEMPLDVLLPLVWVVVRVRVISSGQRFHLSILAVALPRPMNLGTTK